MDLAYLGRARLKRFVCRGGHIDNVPGYYINLMRTLVTKEAPCAHWDTEAIEKRDQVKHQRALAKNDHRTGSNH